MIGDFGQLVLLKSKQVDLVMKRGGKEKILSYAPKWVPLIGQNREERAERGVCTIQMKSVNSLPAGLNYWEEVDFGHSLPFTPS